jgi:hypothetical protein
LHSATPLSQPLLSHQPRSGPVVKDWPVCFPRTHGAGILEQGLRTQKILLAKFDTIMAEDAVRRRDVKINIRQQVIHEIGQSLHVLGAATGLP